ncbi:camk protein kinase [Plasmopara halstedii]|uniref:Camk protein kinase n=1 Tax=Plasmopara halstedii TaxID=4781 RepID=A0A0P1ARY6_PLAHL|nr:camk protein kinase [Plasmopara halstedii]CEG44472.1 camk protein kinase [Plasmopara halstedii]|eukprot:XP_024580841.1 camk protein kinase [Plasmopara halstedii]
MHLPKCLTRASVLDKVAPLVVHRQPTYKRAVILYGDKTGWTGYVAAATLFGVAIYMKLDASSSNVEFKSSDDHWWMNPNIEKRGQYALSKELGRGGFSIVRLAIDTKTKQTLAAKIFDSKSSSMESIQAEINILRHLGTHPNIVSLRDVLYLENETIMLTDLVEGGELFDFIVNMGSVSEQDAAHLLHDVCLALDYVHSRGVCHCDLKPENVLLSDQSTKANVKIADFGSSRRQQKGEKIVDHFPNGTVAYWAPEIVSLQPQDFSVDMWAFGVLAYITLTGVHPFDPRGDKSDAEIVKEIAHGNYDVENKWYTSLTAGAKDFLTTTYRPNQARLQQLRANILAVVMGVNHAKLGITDDSDEKHLTSCGNATVNKDTFKETFALFDKDESGCIDRDELKGMLQALGQQLSSSEIDSIMRQADTDGDGRIQFTEFVSMMNQRLLRRGELSNGDLKTAFNIFDVNHDGHITSSELKHILHILGNKHMSIEEVYKIIQAADSNDDGKIDFDEFCALMQHQK